MPSAGEDAVCRSKYWVICLLASSYTYRKDNDNPDNICDMINHILHRLSKKSVLTGVLQLIEDTERGENIYNYNYVLISIIV